ncbi:MAG: efflux RND transporter permease subunit [Geminicoccaceae bacterium]|nr:efflux RND transporter permease subunit [Geminicoccaceae bacterium]
MNLSAWALRNRSVVAYLMLLAVAAGVMAFLKLGRNEDPAFTIKTMVVQAAWPGATLQETLDQVTERIERKIQELEGLDVVRSFTRAGLATVFVDLEGAVPAADVPKAWQRVRNDIADIWPRMPQGVQGPFFNDRFGDVFGIIYGFTADGFSHRELRDRVEAVRSELLRVPDVSKIELLGAQDEVVFIEFSMRRLASLELDRQALLAAIAQQNLVRPAGIVETGEERIALRVTGAFGDERDILDITFTAGGRRLRIGDIAEVRRGLADPPQPLFRVGGKPAIGLAIAMREGGDILALGKNLEQAMARITAELPVGIEPHLVADQPRVVEEAIADFMTSLWQAVAIILAMSFLSLGVRPGFVVAFAIPLTLAIVFAVMLAFGIDMQRISLGALIIALALLVDDAMTTTDATVTRLAAGDPIDKAATWAFGAYAKAMLAGTLVTIAGFVPIGFAASSAGEYTFTLFAVVAIALVVSWFVAVLFTPLLSTVLLKPPKAGAASGPDAATRAYRAILALALKARWLTIAATLGAFLASVWLLGFVPRQFFPASDRPELVIDLTLPQNASIYASEKVSAEVDRMLEGDPDVARWSTYVGRGAIRFYLPLDVRLANPFFSQLVVVAKDTAARDRLKERLERELPERFPNLVTRLYPLELGPPVGWPIQYRVVGPDPETVATIALELGAVVAANPLTTDVTYDWIEPTREVRVRVDQDQARLLGLSADAIGRVLNTVVSGLPVTQIRDDIYLIDVLVRATDEQRVSLATLGELPIPVPDGRTVPLSQVARLEIGQDFPLVWRRDRLASLTVQADHVAGVLPAEVVGSLAAAIERARAQLPEGFRIEVGGTVEESETSQASVFAVVPAMILIMLTVLMFELKSFQRLFIVLSVAPLGLIGVVAALLPSGRPLGFVALLGVLALVGIIIKNAVILLSQIEADRAAGKSVYDAVVSACTIRFRPIVLTAISTVLGMVPIAPTVFWGPMAFAIMGGLFAATLLTLIFLPALYLAWFGRTDRRRGEPAAATRGEPVAAG